MSITILSHVPCLLVCVCVCVCVIIIVSFFSDCGIDLFSCLAASVFSKLTRELCCPQSWNIYKVAVSLALE